MSGGETWCDVTSRQRLVQACTYRHANQIFGGLSKPFYIKNGGEKSCDTVSLKLRKRKLMAQVARAPENL